MKQAEILLSLQNATKRYETTPVFEDISFDLIAGQITLLLGANGSGKSTLLKALSGLLKLDKGTIEPTISKEDHFKKVAYVAHESHLYSPLTVKENIELFAKLSSEKRTSEELLDFWGLFEHRNKAVENLSRGLAFKTSLVCALLGSPSILLLDEPTSALDSASLDLFCATIQDYVQKRNATAIIATHDIRRLYQIANQVLTINNGAIDSTTQVSFSEEEVVSIYIQTSLK
ncbi:MAG: ABC transporter ATP-binding protein [Deltaproteobacteria bacterium]|nr:ABC transporter ATP-binding protein [Deltaproteobacteria bacterium]